MIGIFSKIKNRIFGVGIVWIMMLTTIMDVEKRWMECEVWIFYGIPVLLLFSFIMFFLRKQRFHYSFTDIIIIVWFAYYVVRTWIGNEWPCKMEFLKTVEFFLLYITFRIAFDGTKMSVWVLIGSIIFFGCYEVWLGASQMYGNSSRHRLFALTGNFLNPGPYSAYLMTGLVVSLASLKEVPNRAVVYSMPTFIPTKIAECLMTIKWKHLIISAIVVMAIILPATWSRAAFLGVAVAALCIFREKYWKNRYIVWGTMLLIGFILYFVKQGSADGRLIIWKSALTTWIDFPWFGVGIGGFYHAFAEGMTMLSTSNINFSCADVPDGAYNILLKILVEQGFTGFLFAVLGTVIILMKLSKHSKPLFYGMVALLIFSMFSYPFDMLPYKVIAVLIIAWSESVEDKQLFEVGRVKVFLLVVFLCLASWQAGKFVNKCYKTEKELYTGLVVYYSAQHYYNWIVLESDNHIFLFEFGKKLREEKRYNDSNAVLIQGTKCSADPMFYILIGNNYKDMKFYDLAEQAYNKAFSVMPNRLYPLYQLMQLYHDSGNMRKARIMAKRVIEMRPKIESIATKKMQEKADSILGKR